MEATLSDLQSMMDQPVEAPVQTNKATLAHVMAAFKEVISAQRQANGNGFDDDSDPTPTELFAVISLTLSTGAAVDHLGKVMKIFSAILPQSNQTILRSQFKTTALTLIRIIKGCSDQIEVIVLALDCLGSLLRAQDSSEGTWSSVQVRSCSRGRLRGTASSVLGGTSVVVVAARGASILEVRRASFFGPCIARGRKGQDD